MQPSPSFWFGWPKEEISATERARQSARRESKLDQHMLNQSGASRATARAEPRDPLELVRGLEVQVLPDSAYDKLFTLP